MLKSSFCTKPQYLIPKQSLIPSPLGVNELGKRYNAFLSKSTFTETVSVLEHPFTSVPVTVYIVVAGGDAMGLAISGLFKPVEGDQIYDAAPVAVNWLDPNEHVRSLALAATTEGNENTVTVVERFPVSLHAFA